MSYRLFLPATLLLTSCSTTHTWYQNTESVQIAPADQQVLAEELSRALLSEYDPDIHVIHISTLTEFGHILESKLHQLGFNVKTVKEPQTESGNSVFIAYKINQFSESILHVQLIADENWKYDRLYRQDPKTKRYVPYISHTVMGSGNPIPEFPKNELNTHNEDDFQQPKTKEIIEKPKGTSFLIYEDETYHSAFSRWAAKVGLKGVVTSNQEIFEQLNTHVDEPMSFEGNISQAFNVMIQTGSDDFKGLKLHIDSSRKIAAIHHYNRPVQTLFVNGLSLRDALHNVISDYGWKFGGCVGENYSSLEGCNQQNNYRFNSSYPIITAKGDIATALHVILEGYPLKAQLMYSNRTVWIAED